MCASPSVVQSESMNLSTTTLSAQALRTGDFVVAGLPNIGDGAEVIKAVRHHGPSGIEIILETSRHSRLSMAPLEMVEVAGDAGDPDLFGECED